MVNTNQAISTAKQILIKNDIDEREARLLLAFVLGINHQELIKRNEISDEEYAKFLVVLEKRCQGIPYAYIVGHKEFMRLDFIVNKNVLIPREDTEVVVEQVINLVNNCFSKKTINILDMCTGSGCIAISLANYIEGAKVVAVDNSKEALKVASQNAVLNGVLITFIKSNLFNEIDLNTKFDIIVSNPPYIKTSVINSLQKEVKENEPMMALDGGEDGLEFYRVIVKEAKKYLNPNGYLVFEIGYDQAEEVQKLLGIEEYKNIRVVKDYSSNDRVVIANI